jgi:hypothetical protein
LGTDSTQNHQIAKYSNAFSHILVAGSLILAFLTAMSAIKEHTRKDLDNIVALLSKDQNHEKCREIDCFNRAERIHAILREASRIPIDVNQILAKVGRL